MPVPSDMPLVSVVVPAYNRAHLLPRVVGSILGQSYDAVEAVVVDDGSSDETSSILERLAAEHGERLRWVTQENAGCAAASNHGVALARGELVAVVGDDDEWLPTAAETLVAALVAKPEAALVYAPAVEAFPSGTERVFEPVAAGDPDGFSTAHFMDTNLRSGAFLFRRAVVEEVGNFDESLRHNEDSDFVQRVAIAYPVAYSPVPAVRVHHHAENKSSDRVAITEALLQSARNVLAAQPEFAAKLGSQADERIRALQSELLESLVLAGRFEEAAELRREGVEANGPVRFALLTRSLLPVRAEQRWRRARGRGASAMLRRRRPGLRA